MEAEIETEFRLIAQPYVTLKSGQVRCIACVKQYFTLFYCILAIPDKLSLFIIITMHVFIVAAIKDCVGILSVYWLICRNIATIIIIIRRLVYNQYPEFNYFIYICIRILFLFIIYNIITTNRIIFHTNIY